MNEVRESRAGMVPGFRNRYDGTGPHFEVWYGKINVGPGRAFWFRYTIFDGALQEASTWAVLFDEGEKSGGRSYWELDELATPNTVALPEGRERGRFSDHHQVFHTDGAHLDGANALGEAGGISWDLTWEDSGRRFTYLPPILERVPVVDIEYDACFLDLRVSGTIEHGDDRWEIDGRPGMIGHISGADLSGDTWVWAHCNDFVDEDEAVFEGLSIHLNVLGMTIPSGSVFIVYVDGRAYPFRTLRSIFGAESTFDRSGWEFEVESGGVRLSGRAEAPPPERVALVAYDDTDGSDVWCYNSKLADLTIRLEDPANGVDRTLRAEGTSAFEFMTRETPEERPLI